MKKYLSSLLAFVVMAMMSCGGSDQLGHVELADTPIVGSDNPAELFEITNVSPVILEGYENGLNHFIRAKVTLTIKCIKNKKDNKQLTPRLRAEGKVYLLDEYGSILYTSRAIDFPKEEGEEKVINVEFEEVSDISVDNGMVTDESILKKILTPVKKLQVDADYLCWETISEPEMEVNSSEEDSESISYNDEESSDSEDWDSVLDSYEQYVNKYVSLAKKAAKGDMSAMSEYPSLMEKAQELSDKLSNAKSNMTSSQQSRYMKITQKMANMAASL